MVPGRQRCSTKSILHRLARAGHTHAKPWAGQAVAASRVRLTGGPLKHVQDLMPIRSSSNRSDAALFARARRPDAEGSAVTGAGMAKAASHRPYCRTLSFRHQLHTRRRAISKCGPITSSGELKEIQDKQATATSARAMANVPRTRGGTNNPAGAAATGGTNTGRAAGARTTRRCRTAKCVSMNWPRRHPPSGFDLNGMWSPRHVQHKLYADCATRIGSREIARR